MDARALGSHGLTLGAKRRSTCCCPSITYYHQQKLCNLQSRFTIPINNIRMSRANNEDPESGDTKGMLSAA